MLKNYFKIAFRNLFKNKLYSSINIIGFSIGLAAALLTFLFVIDEIRVNRHYDNIDQIYWVKVEHHRGENVVDMWGCPPATGHYLKETYPEILESAVLANGSSGYLLKYNNKKFVERVKCGQFSTFKIFSHELIQGHIPANDDINSIIIDDEIAEKFFGNENPIGKIMQLDGKYDLKVAAVFKRMINNATDRFKILCPFPLLDRLWESEGATTTWENHAFRIFVKTNKTINIDSFNKKINGIIKLHNPNTLSHPYLYPFKDKYLYEHEAIENVKTYSIITLLLLIVAAINYINLSTAQATKRAREVGIRKVVGAQRKQIIIQFLFESLIITIIALFIAGILIDLVYPFWTQFNSMTVPLSGVYTDSTIFIGVFSIILFTSILTSLYPAFILSSFLPKKVLQGDLKTGKLGKSLRSGLVLVQFAVSIALIIITITIYQQVDFMKNKKLGFEKDQIVYMDLPGKLQEKAYLVKNQIKEIPGVINVCLSSHIPGTGGRWNTTSFTWEGKDEKFLPLINENSYDEHVLNTYDIKLIEGTSRSESITPSNKVLINETLAGMMNHKNVLGKLIRYKYSGRQYEVIGIITDFHHTAVRNRVEPFIFYTDESRMSFSKISFKFEALNIQNILKEVEQIITTIENDYPFEYHFLDEVFAEMYEQEERVQMTVQFFGFIAIFVSCLGLFGMASFSSQQRTKEIGIRKVLGAKVISIISLLLKEFTKWVIISNVIAWPCAYYYLKGWLADYPYRINLGLELFLLSGLAALILAIITVVGQAYFAATSNPIKCLRTE